MVSAVPTITIQEAVDDMLRMRVFEVGSHDRCKFGTHGFSDYRPIRFLLAIAAAATLLHAQPSVSGRAAALHRAALVFDGHIHAVDREFYHGGDIGERKPDGQFDLDRAREGGLGAFFFSIFVTEDYYPGRLETRQALRMVDCALDQIGRNSQTVELARNASDIERI